MFGRNRGLVQSGRESPTGSFRPKRDLPIAMVAIATQLALSWWMRGFVTDDALITLRYARQWAFGNGITWNAETDPVEGFTNFSQVALGALALHLDIPALGTLRVLNVMAGAGSILLTYLLALRLTRSRAWAGIAAWIVGIHPAFAYWTVSGLETSLYAAALLLGVYAIEIERRWLACAAFVFASLTRFEGAFAALAVASTYLAIDFAQTKTAALRRHLPWIAVWLVAYAVYFAWRYDHFGHPMPNSAYYKSAGDSGAALLRAFAFQTAPLLALVLLAPFRRSHGLPFALLSLLGLYLVGYYGVKPSVSYMHRFFLPVYAPVALLGTAALHRLWQASRERSAARTLAALALALVIGWDLSNPASGLRKALGRSHAMSTRMISRAQVAAFVAEHYPPSAVVAAQDVGVIGYGLLNPILDTFGLNDEAFTHRFALHRSEYLHWLLAKSPDVIVLVSRSDQRLKSVYATDEIIAADPRFARYLQVHVVKSPNEPYHYLIYAREDLEQARSASEIRVAKALDDDLASWLERVARAIWSMQRAHVARS